jgi:hypothetical protein
MKIGGDNLEPTANNQTAAERLKTFLKLVDEFITCNHLNVSKFSMEWAMAETFDIATMDTLTQDDCFNYAFMLYQYADHVGSQRAKMQNVIRWCETSLNSIMGQEFDTELIAKHEVKYARVLRGNALAKKIHDWKDNAASKVEGITNREYNIRRKADILIEKGKRK